MKTIKFLLLLTVLCTACNPEKIDTRRIKKEMEERKIKRISEGEIIHAADSIGNLITDSLQQVLSQKLDSSFSKGGVEAALPFCKMSNIPEKDSLEHIYNVKISKVSLLPIFAPCVPNAHEKEIMEAYSYSQTQKFSLSSNVEIAPDKILFYKPIIANEQNCMKCYGTPGKDFSENDLLGMWSLAFDKKEIIKHVK